MKEITFNAQYLGKRCSFVISEVSGANSTWYLYIDDYFKGKFAFIGDRWVFLPQHEDYFTPAQIAILEEQMRAHQAANG